MRGPPSDLSKPYHPEGPSPNPSRCGDTNIQTGASQEFLFSRISVSCWLRMPLGTGTNFGGHCFGEVDAAEMQMWNSGLFSSELLRTTCLAAADQEVDGNLCEYTAVLVTHENRGNLADGALILSRDGVPFSLQKLLSQHK
ncbi:hypothetical protein D623_10035064 [Myotis brandtii]|uniref:Uncharacterized protein n=1 Tax=Myotis brandtii TaxID=109478 RepID=S7P4C5_MYOBR|nr:hypothetical protein D623_10035064 [Myotis brandtii]